ncbi:hypothetical protein KA005_49180 [bacterium]|nr:hypothetical protein [bacterium]
MIKNSIFDAYERMDKKALETMAAAYEADYAVAASAQACEFIKVRLSIIYALLKYKIHNNWLPTSENINALPEPVRKFIYDIETNTDPAHIVRENILIKDTCKALLIKLEEKRKVDQAFVNIWANEFATATLADKTMQKRVAYMLKEAGVKVVKK